MCGTFIGGHLQLRWVGQLWQSELLFFFGRYVQSLDRAGLHLKPKKCKFIRERVEYLGHVISKHGIEVDPIKVAAMKDFPQPTNLKSLKSLLGLASYCRQFIPNSSSVAGPLHLLTHKDIPFVWSSSWQEAFELLKHLLTIAPVLGYPDFEHSFMLKTDSSHAGLGAVLAQNINGIVHPVSFASLTLQPPKRTME